MKAINIFSLFRLRAFGLATALFATTSAHASINLVFAESGSDVTITVSGSLDFSGLASPAFRGNSGSVFLGGPSTSNLQYVAGQVNGQTYDSTDGFTSFNATAFQTFNPPIDYPLSGFSDVNWGIDFNTDSIITPDGYTAGDAITTSVITLSGASFSSLNISPGIISSAVFETGAGVDSINFSAVPEPSSFAMLASLGIAGLLVRKRNRD